MAFDFPASPTLGQTYQVTGGPTYVWNGTAWQVLTPGSRFNRQVYTATAGQTTFNATYLIGGVDVFHNGVKLAPVDFTASNGSTVVLVSAANAGDTIEVVSYSQVNYTNAVQKTGDTMTGNLNFSGNGLRITGDFANATDANRLQFQNSSANSATAVGIIPSGSATFSGLVLSNSSDPNNAGQLYLQANGASYTGILATKTGTGSFLPMAFFTGGSERVRIDTSGNVGIGLTNPNAKLEVSGLVRSTQSETVIAANNNPDASQGYCMTESGASGDARRWMMAIRAGTGATNREVIYRAINSYFNYDAQAHYFNVNGSTKLYMPTGGGVYIGSSAWFAMNGAGDQFLVYANGANGGGGYFYYNSANNYGTVSDQRIKHSISELNKGEALAFINRLKPASFAMNGQEELQAGFIAQEVLSAAETDVQKSAVANTATYTGAEDDPLLGVSDRPILAMLVAAVQELSAKLDAAEARIAQLEGTN